ncbi:SusC/RagA family TonB-linked outer membrane protein [Niabella drilacis]|uniref:TonB-linked outer membrane protein, SusC/RagA family n=1 Tax=Niabella drilacis (strain DSM 25811 / CCM 8410 / CCUG 62505 / LMG 26954 / E90) TaxID=1285928 RepID=A0A1G6YM77_NIADE|nr:TonB-dependent receptor [Niabella drilacis]SDD90767.1 TonB-linked outer membrane protein, SusC/RagA family [Niabella drilacis]
MCHHRNRKIATFLFFAVGLLISFTGNAQVEPGRKKIQITGLVTDSAGAPLNGVSVGIKTNASSGTMTNVDGQYIFEVSPGTTLVYSFVGFREEERSITDTSKVINVTLYSKGASQDEVVVVAYGTQKKRELVGSVTSVSVEDLQKVPTSNLTTALAGRVAGLIAYQRTGEPGQDNADFFIRGVTTFGYKKDPLILIDGVELTTTDLARLRPDDIESFSIMKDAASTSLYGARGANGVILVSTKRGKTGAAKIAGNYETSISQPTQNLKFVNPVDYMKLYNEAVYTRTPIGDNTIYPEEKIANTAAGANPYVYPANDWLNALFKKQTINQRANLNVSGGGTVARYFVSTSFTQDNGILKVDKLNNFNNNINLKSYTLRSNVDIDLTKTTLIKVNLAGNFDDYNGPLQGGSAMYEKVMHSNPVRFPGYYPTPPELSYLKHTLFGNVELQPNVVMMNPYAEMVKGYKDESRSFMSAQMEVKQNLNFLARGLNFRVMANVNRTSNFSTTRQFIPFWYEVSSYNRATDKYGLRNINPEGGTEYLNYVPGDRQLSASFYMESALNYNRSFGSKHNFGQMLIYTMRHKVDGNDDIQGSLQKSLPYRNLSLSGRTTYNYDNKYLLEFDFGYNGTERFYEDKRFGFFPSIGAGWQVSSEKFMERFNKVISNLKLRGTYGLVGNDAIGDAGDRFFYLSETKPNETTRGAVFGENNIYSKPGYLVTRYSNANITWEKSYQMNLALELGLFDKLNFIGEYYTNDRHNILMTRPEFTTMGLSDDIRANVGRAKSSGVDLSLDYSDHFGKDFWASGRANFTYAKSRFLAYEEPDYVEPWRSHVGYSLSQQWGYIAERLFVDDEEARNAPIQRFGNDYGGGDIKYLDVNRDGEITEADLVPIGYPTSPQIVYGFGFSLGYKAFDFSAFFQGLAQESFWLNVTRYNSSTNKGSTLPFVDEGAMLQAYADDHWSEANQNVYALWPRLSSTVVANNAQRNTWFMRDGAFLRLKQAEIGYSLPQALIRRIRSNSCRVYINGSNLLSFSKFKLWDVEQAGNGFNYPVQRVFNIGVRISFD